MAHFWFAFDIGAYEDSTAHLTMLQDGAYNRLLRHYYKTGKPIPESSEQIVRISGAHSTEEIEAVLYILKSFFCLKSDGYHNKRADKEIVKARQLSKLRASSAKRRWDDKRNAKPMQLHNSTDAKADTVTVTVTSNTKPERKKRAHSLPEYFVPNPSHYDIARQVGVIVDMEFPKFRDFFLGNGALKVDWDRTFNNWLRNAPSYGGNRGRTNADQRNTQPARQPSAQVARYHNNLAEVERAFGAAAVGSIAGANSPRQTPRLSTGDTPALEGEVTKL